MAKIPDVGAAKICAADYIDPAGAWQACRVIRFAALAAAGFARLIALCWQLQAEQESEMGQKQILTRTQIAKMSGHENTHFLNPRAKRVTKPLVDLGGLQHPGFHLITLSVGSVASEFH